VDDGSKTQSWTSISTGTWKPVETQPEQKTVKCAFCDIDTDAYYAVPFKIGRSDAEKLD